MTLKKKLAILISGVMLTAFVAGCGGGDKKAADNKPIVMKLAENQPADYPTTIGDREFAKIVDEKTKGRIKIEVYPGGQLGDEKSVIEAVQMGGIELARVNAQPLSDFAKPLRVLSLPFVFRDSDHLWKTLNGPVGEEILVTLQPSKMVGLTYYDSGSRNFYNSKREVKTPADMKGLKIRVQQSELMMDLVKALGASPTPMAYGEVYSGLQSGVIDGAENNWPSYYSTSHYEVAKNLTLNGHTRTPEVVIVSKAVWDKLSKEDQKILKDAAMESQKVQRKAWEDYEKKSIDAVKAKGNQITEIDVTVWQEAVKPVLEKHGKDVKGLVDKISAVK